MNGLRGLLSVTPDSSGTHLSIVQVRGYLVSGGL